MSIVKEVVLEKVVERLKDNLQNFKTPARNIRTMIDERVPPDTAEEFIGVFGNDVSSMVPPRNTTKQHNYAFTVGITRRVLTIPSEWAGEYILTYNDERVVRTKPSMFARANEIVDILEDANGWTLLSAINAIVGPVGCFLVPFGLETLDVVPEIKNEDHFDVVPSRSGQPSPRYVGLYIGLTFSGAEYYKPS